MLGGGGGVMNKYLEYVRVEVFVNVGAAVSTLNQRKVVDWLLPPSSCACFCTLNVCRALVSNFLSAASRSWDPAFLKSWRIASGFIVSPFPSV